MKPLKQGISITVDADVLEKTKQLAEDVDRSLSQYINLVLKEHLRKTRIKNRILSKHPAGCFFLLDVRPEFQEIIWFLM